MDGCKQHNDEKKTVMRIKSERKYIAHTLNYYKNIGGIV